jgi:hypothetical protein
VQSLLREWCMLMSCAFLHAQCSDCIHYKASLNFIFDDICNRATDMHEPVSAGPMCGVQDQPPEAPRRWRTVRQRPGKLLERGNNRLHPQQSGG